jgi:hypothetical protein
MSGAENSRSMIDLLHKFDLSEIGPDDFVINFQKAWRQLAGFAGSCIAE